MRPARLSFVIFLVAMSMHAYQGNAEDVEPNPERRNGDPAHKLPAASFKQEGAAQGRRATENKNADPEHSWGVLLERTADPVTWFTGLLVLVGSLQWWALRTQVQKMTAQLAAATTAANAAKGSVELSREVAQRELTAYVFDAGAQLWNVTPGVATPGASAAEKADVARYADYGPIAVIRIKNFGRTPAYSFSSQIWGIEVADPNTPTLVNSSSTEGFGEPKRRAVLPPDSYIDRKVVRRTPLTADERTAIQKGTIALYIWGEVGYRDVFGFTVTYEFRLVHGAAQYGTHGVAIAASDSGNRERRETYQQVLNA